MITYGFCGELYEADPPTQDFWPDDPPWEAPSVPHDYVPDYPWLERAIAEMRQRQAFAERYHRLQLQRHREKQVPKVSASLRLVQENEANQQEPEPMRSLEQETVAGFRPRLIPGDAKPKPWPTISFAALNREEAEAPTSPQHNSAQADYELHSYEPHSYEPYNIWEQDGPADRKILILSADEALKELLITPVDEYSPRELWPHLLNLKRTIKAVEKHLKAEEGPAVKRLMGHVRSLFGSELED